MIRNYVKYVALHWASDSLITSVAKFHTDAQRRLSSWSGRAQNS